MEERPLEHGWLPDTPIGDTVLRRFVYNQADLNGVVAQASGGRSARTDAVAIADAGGVVPYFNQAVLLRPVLEAGDQALDEAEAFYAGTGRPATLLSLWPTPDLTARGWHLVGHPAFVVRPPGPHDTSARPGVEVRTVTTAEDLRITERIAIEGYPLDEARDLPPGSLLPAAVLDSGVTYRLGFVDGEPVAAAGRYVGSGVVNLCFAATLPAARRRRVWSALVWARVDDAADLPAVAYTSDYSRPGFERMGFVVILRMTLWFRVG